MNWRIGTRGSKLALAQASFVKAWLEMAFPDDSFKLVVISTRGDRETGKPIAALGDTALFTREIERELLEGRIDLAVHSMKDLPSTCSEGLCLAKAWTREDPCDALVLGAGRTSLDDLPLGATVATGSPRRTVQLRRMRPDLKIVGIRGNVDTRLRKLDSPAADEPRLDGIVLAVAGLKRLGLAERITERLPAETMIPAANQGTLALELRADDTLRKARLDELGSDESETVAAAERGFLREIGADCHVPVGAFARVSGGQGVSLRCMFARSEDETPAFAEVVAATSNEAARKAAAEIRRQLAGTVVLVGAGPGDPGLITVRGLEAIRSADCIVHDRLVSDELLKSARADCELVYVGKASGNHTLPQSEINALLVRQAMKCRRVVRLKGGDPFVFGRGGEEMEHLLACGVSCSVVPGVTSAIAAPASVGIPVTHRGVAQGFEVVTAHAKDDEPLEIDFSRLLDPKRTIVFLMGLKRIPELSASLVAAGRDAATPAGVVGSGTTPQARCVVGTLADIARKTAEAAIASPAILVVGDVVRMRAKLGFPLSGRRFLVPEIGAGKSRVASLLRQLGAEVDVSEVGRIVATGEDIPLAGVTWLAFTSRNGLLPFDAAQVAGVKRRGIRVAAIGKATASAVAEKGLPVDFVSSVQTGDGLLKELVSVLKPDDCVLHPTAEGVKTALGGLAEVCTYRAVAVYRNEEVRLAGALDLDAYDAALFTCASSVRRLYAQAKGSTRVLSIGPATTAALTELGVRAVETAGESSAEALVALALRCFQ